MKRIFERLGPVGWVVFLALAIPLAEAAWAEPPSDRSVTEQIVASLSPGAASPAGAALKSPIEQAKHALERASGARAAGDVHHAELLESLAREWAETARDLARAVAIEAEAGTLEGAASEAGLAAERARALLEEAMARRGRAEAELAQLSADAGLFPTKPAPPPARPKPVKSVASGKGGR